MSKVHVSLRLKRLVWLLAAAVLALHAAPQAAAEQPAQSGPVRVAAVDDDDATPSAEPEQGLKAGACAGAFHSALARISTTRGADLKQAIESAKSGWRKLRGRWQFPPGRGGRDKAFRFVVQRAARLVRRRGIDRKLKHTVQNEILARMAADLQVYVGQPPAPALCTGAPQYMDFFDGRLGPFRRDEGSAADLFERAAQVADWKLNEAQRALDAPLELPEDAGADAFAADTDQLHHLYAIARATWSTIVDADDTPGLLYAHVSALARSRADLKQIRFRRRSPLRARYQTIYTAFTAIEGLAYIQSSHANHHRIGAGFGDTILAVRSAHARNCVCAQ